MASEPELYTSGVCSASECPIGQTAEVVDAQWRVTFRGVPYSDRPEDVDHGDASDDQE